MRYVSSGRAELATDVHGTGSALVFLHANVCDRRMWQHQLDQLSRDHKVIAYDRRGFGETRAAAEPFSALEDLVAVLDATTPREPALLVGASLGGRIALDAALRRPSRVRGLVLTAPNVAGAPEPVYPAEIAPLMMRLKEAEASGDLDRQNALKARLFLDGPLAPEGRVGGALRDLFLDMNGRFLRASPFGEDVDIRPLFDRLADVAVPTLILWGTLDLPHVQERCRHVAATIPGALSHEIDGAAHLPSFERPVDLTGLIADFASRC